MYQIDIIIIGGSMKKRKTKKKVFRFLILLLIVCAFFVYKKFITNDLNAYTAYISSINPKVDLYDSNFNKVGDIYRGSEVYLFEHLIENNENKYYKIIFNKKEYYVLSDDISSSYDNSIKEKKMYVRTPVTVYKDYDNVNILSYVPKGSSLDIIGFDKLEQGLVNMYKVNIGNKEGYVYGKYLAVTEEEALKNYDEENTYIIHKNRHFAYELYGGYASELDYYPYNKPNFNDNVMPSEVKALYINGSAISNIDDYLTIASISKINAFVVDIYDGYMAYESDVMKEYSLSAYESATRSKEEYKKLIDKIKSKGYYVIGRIVAFNNPHFAKDNPTEAIENTKWVSAYSRKAWECNVKLALEAIESFGFNEIQYDYVRFPEASYSWSKNGYDFKNKYNESKGQAIQNFLFYATDSIHRKGAYISADVFGESANTYVTAYGQYFPAISNIVDAISAMPYPDHFSKYEYGFKEPVWTVPYDLLAKWGSNAKKRQEEIPTPAKARTWVQAYDTIREPYVIYDDVKIEEQIKALYASGLNDGYITWNATSNISKYKSVVEAFKKEYR